MALDTTDNQTIVRERLALRARIASILALAFVLSVLPGVQELPPLAWGALGVGVLWVGLALVAPRGLLGRLAVVWATVAGVLTLVGILAVGPMPIPIAVAIMAFSGLVPGGTVARSIQALVWMVVLGVAAFLHGPEWGALGLVVSGLGAIGAALVASWGTHAAWGRRDTPDEAEFVERLTALEADVEHSRTRLAAQEEALVAADRLATVGRLAVGIGHEINNPLAIALTNLEYARSEGDLAVLDDVVDALHRIRNIVADLARVARPDEADEIEDLRLDQVFGRAIQLGRMGLQGAVRIEVEPLPPLGVRANAGRIEQVLVNLLVNASHAIADGCGTSVWISCRTLGQSVLLCVDDDGPGIPEDQYDVIFEPFYTSKPRGKGTGLGLAISRAYIRAMSGDLTADRSPRGGARFIIRLQRSGPGVDLTPIPLLEVEPAAAEEPVVARTPGKPVLMIIDDEPALRRSLARGLRRDYEVHAASGADEAEQILDRVKVDVVLCDLVLRQEDGLEVLERLAKKDPEVLRHALIMSGEPSTGRLVSFARQNRPHMVRKPFDMAGLSRRLVAALNGHKVPVNLFISESEAKHTALSLPPWDQKV